MYVLLLLQMTADTMMIYDMVKFPTMQECKAELVAVQPAFRNPTDALVCIKEMNV